MSHRSRKSQVIALLKGIETGERRPAAVIHPETYRQHNLTVPDGLAGFIEVLGTIPPGSTRVNTIRVLVDGDYVVTHTDYDFFGPKIGFDVFRFEGDHIVEHWDNLQETPASPNPSGRSMIDGPTEILDLHKTEANRALVSEFVENVLVHGDRSQLADYFDGDTYVQHSPGVADGLSGLNKAIEAMASCGITMTYETFHHAIAEGNFVLTISEGRFGSTHVAYYDLFRVQDDKIAEHWDVIEAIPARSAWRNNNGKF